MLHLLRMNNLKETHSGLYSVRTWTSRTSIALFSRFFSDGHLGEDHAGWLSRGKPHHAGARNIVTPDLLLNLMLRRMLQSDPLVAAYSIDRDNVLNDIAAQRAVFYRVFPRQVDVRRKEAIHL